MLQRIKKHKKVIVGIAIVGIVVIVGVVIHNSKKTKLNVEEDASVLAFQLQKQDMTSSISTSGTVESSTVTDVTTELTSPIKELKVSLGEHVEKGQVLCTFDGEEIQQQISELQKQQAASQHTIDANKQRAAQALENAQSQAESKRIALEEAQKTYKEIKKSENNDKNSQALIDALTAVQSAQGEYDSAFSTVTEAQNTLADATNTSVETNSELTKLQNQLGDLTVTAAQSGTITQLNVSQGSIPNGSLMKIEDADALKVKVNIKEKDILKLKVGQKATVVSDAVGVDQKFSATVEQIINFATSSNTGGESTTQENGYSAIISLEPGTPLLLGMSVKVDIVLNAGGEQLAVPYDAVTVEKKNNQKGYVFKGIKQDNDTYKVEKQQVEIGTSNDYYTSISGKDIKEGDIIISDPTQVSEGDTIPLNILSEEKSISYDGDNSSSDTTTISEE